MGFQRTFALPITLLCLWASVARRYASGSVCRGWPRPSSTPIVIPVLGIASGIVFLRDVPPERRLPPGGNGMAGQGAIAIALVLFRIRHPSRVSVRCW